MSKLFRNTVLLLLSMSSIASYAQTDQLRTFDNLAIYVSDCSDSVKPIGKLDTSFPNHDRLQLACERYQNELPFILSMMDLSIKVIRPKSWKASHQETPVNEDEDFPTKYRLYLRGITHGGSIHGFGGFFTMDIMLQDSSGNRITNIGSAILQGSLESDESLEEVVENAERLTLDQMGCNQMCFKALKKKPRN